MDWLLAWVTAEVLGTIVGVALLFIAWVCCDCQDVSEEDFSI